MLSTASRLHHAEHSQNFLLWGRTDYLWRTGPPFPPPNGSTVSPSSGAILGSSSSIVSSSSVLICSCIPIFSAPPIPLIKGRSQTPSLLNSAAESLGALDENRIVTSFSKTEKWHVFRFSAAPSWP